MVEATVLYQDLPEGIAEREQRERDREASEKRRAVEEAERKAKQEKEDAARNIAGRVQASAQAVIQCIQREGINANSNTSMQRLIEVSGYGYAPDIMNGYIVPRCRSDLAAYRATVASLPEQARTLANDYIVNAVCSRMCVIPFDER